MNRESAHGRFIDRLVQEDVLLSDADYEQYRGSLTETLEKAERGKRVSLQVAVYGYLLSFVLMFVGGDRVFGAFDPFDNEANLLSVCLGGIYVLSLVAAPVAIASYFSRFRPRSRQAQDQIVGLQLLRLQQEIRELREYVRERLPEAPLSGG